MEILLDGSAAKKAVHEWLWNLICSAVLAVERASDIARDARGSMLI